MPLCLSTEEHFTDLLAATTVSIVGLVQDFLPMLITSEGRIVNVWASDASLAIGRACSALSPAECLTYPAFEIAVPAGALAPAQAVFRAATRTLALELSPFNVSVSIVLPCIFIFWYLHPCASSDR
jgi:NAD(P)-dependent dehydrogenase (short-subunit alcohol dehydrogenase family)